MKLALIETMPEHLGTTWTKTTVYEGRRPLFIHIWADNIITSRLIPTDNHEPQGGAPMARSKRSSQSDKIVGR